MGWIKLDRKIMENWIWSAEPFDKAHAWIDLLMLATHEDEAFMSRGRMVNLSRGQLIIGRKWLAKRWKWSENKVLRFLGVLTAQGMAQVDGTPNGTVLTLINYDKYQNRQTPNGTTDGTPDGTTDGTTDGTLSRSIRTKEYKKPSTTDEILDEWMKLYGDKEEP